MKYLYPIIVCYRYRERSHYSDLIVNCQSDLVPPNLQAVRSKHLWSLPQCNFNKENSSHWRMIENESVNLNWMKSWRMYHIETIRNPDSNASIFRIGMSDIKRWEGAIHNPVPSGARVCMQFWIALPISSGSP